MSTEIQETINRLRELDRTASPAPWYIEEHESMIVTGDEETGEEVGAVFFQAMKSKKSKANAAILTEARNAIPALLAEIERLAEENQTLKRENHLAWSKGHAAGWDCHIVTMQAADLLPKDQKTSSPEKGA